MSSENPSFDIFFFFNDTATTEIYTLSLHDALPIYYLALAIEGGEPLLQGPGEPQVAIDFEQLVEIDRKSTRLNSSHSQISYAVFCLKKKKHSMHRHTLSRDHGARRAHMPSPSHTPS